MAPTQNYPVPNHLANDRSVVLLANLYPLHGVVHSAGNYAGSGDLISALLDTSGHNVRCMGAVLRMCYDNHWRDGEHSCIWTSDLGLDCLHEDVELVSKNVVQRYLLGRHLHSC